jgi:23S rRNA (guanosine2251-2'-O)-methyltransferase
MSARPARRDGAPAPRRADEPGPLRERRSSLIYGRNAVLEAARAGRVRRALLARGLEPDARMEELRRLTQVEEVPASRIDALAPAAHQGVVAELEPRAYMSLRQLLELGPTLLVALDGIEDPQNLGAILRSAEAAGVDGVIVPEHRSAPLSAAAVKASSGASEYLRLCRVPGLPSTVSELKRAGIWCAALDPHGELPLWQFDLRLPVCLVVGGEGRGVHRLVRERCDVRLRLPMRGRISTLNASAAMAVGLYEVVRQRTLAGGGP